VRAAEPSTIPLAVVHELHVGPHEVEDTAALAHLVRKGLAELFSATGPDDLHASTRELDRDPTSDPGRDAGDDGNAPRETHVVGSYPTEHVTCHPQIRWSHVTCSW